MLLNEKWYPLPSEFICNLLCNKNDKPKIISNYCENCNLVGNVYDLVRKQLNSYCKYIVKETGLEGLYSVILSILKR